MSQNLNLKKILNQVPELSNKDELKKQTMVLAQQIMKKREERKFQFSLKLPKIEINWKLLLPIQVSTLACLFLISQTVRATKYEGEVPFSFETQIVTNE